MDEDLSELLEHTRVAAVAEARKKKKKKVRAPRAQRVEADRKVAVIEARWASDQEGHAREVDALKKEIADLQADIESQQHVRPEVIRLEAVREYKSKVLLPLSTKARLECREDGIKEGFDRCTKMVGKYFPYIDLSRLTPEEEDEDEDEGIGEGEAGEGSSRV